LRSLVGDDALLLGPRLGERTLPLLDLRAELAHLADDPGVLL
jgi:hypothetical protein